jgi:glycosyltransferase involved in cell wall biosynthesis
MRVAFYAPLKPPDHRNPSGDRQLARLFMSALGRGGFEVELMSRFRSRDGGGDTDRQHRLALIGGRLAERLVRRLSGRDPGQRPAAWLSYHVYHKAPDWIGPAVTAALGIPYIVAEASDAPKQQDGPWSIGFRQARRAIASASAVINVNSTDLPCLRAIVHPSTPIVQVPPFSDFGPDLRPPSVCRAEVGRRFEIPDHAPWLVTVAMMRPGDKTESYRLLVDALERLGDRDWRLVIAGDGSGRVAIEEDCRRRLGDRCLFTGRLDRDGLAPLLRAADVFVWPAVNEAFGMAILEAQISGLPVVAGDSRGVGDIVVHGTTGLLAPVGDAVALAAHVRRLLDDGDERRRLAAAAFRNAAATHTLDAVAPSIAGLIRGLVRT